eukprot:981083-Prymnesium_polylepis.1
MQPVVRQATRRKAMAMAERHTCTHGVREERTANGDCRDGIVGRQGIESTLHLARLEEVTRLLERLQAMWK